MATENEVVVIGFNVSLYSMLECPSDGENIAWWENFADSTYEYIPLLTNTLLKQIISILTNCPYYTFSQMRTNPYKRTDVILSYLEPFAY